MTAPPKPDLAADPVGVRPLSGHTGALITGMDLSRPLTPDQVDTVRGALARWKVVFFRDQDVGHAEHVAFTRQFGELTAAHPYDDDPPDGFPEIYTVSPERFAAQYGHTGEAAATIRRRYSYSNEWHTDVTAAVNPPAGSVLRAEVVPEYGGDTLFTNLVAAYEGLSAPVRQFVDGLWAEHRYGADLARRGLAQSRIVQANPLVAHHPVVRVHPVTGERGLFVNPGFTSHILDVRPEESTALLAMLFAHLTADTYTVRFHWEPGSVAFWDNRATAHRGPQDIDHLDVARVLHRVTLLGEVPVAPDGRASELIDGQPFTAPGVAPDLASRAVTGAG